jgi:dTMP kinase
MAEPAVDRRPRRESSLAALFRIRVFRRMWAAIAFSSLGDWLGLLANTALAQQLTHSDSKGTQGAAIAAVLLVRLAPDLLFGAVAAAIADKLDRRKTVIAGEVAAAVLYASIAIGYNLIWLYIAQFAIEAAGLFTQPAKQVIWVAIVPKKLLATANQISLMSVYGTVPVAAAVFALLSAAGRVIGGQSTATSDSVNTAIVIALLLNTLSFLVSASTVFLSRADIPVVPDQHEREQGIFSLIREGVAFVRTHPLIRGLYIGIIGAFAGGGLTVGVAQLWVFTLSAGAAGYALMFGAVFTGLAIGLLIGPRMLPGFSRSRVFGLSIGGAGVALVISSVIHDYILALVLATSVGVFAGMAWIIGYTLIGYEVEDRLRGRTFAFVISSVRLMLLATIAVGPLLAGSLGTHDVKIGHTHLLLTGPGLTLLIGGVTTLVVSLYATARSGRTRLRLRDMLRRRLIRGIGRDAGRAGLLLTVDGVDGRATARYAALLADAARELGAVVVETAEPTDSPVGRRVAELLEATGGVEPETAALLSAADRAEHVATVIRPALERGEVVVCDRFVLTSLAVHGAGHGADVEHIRDVNAWSTDALLPDLVLVVTRTDVDDSAEQALLAEAETDPDRCLLCPPEVSGTLPTAVADKLARLLRARRHVLADAADRPGEPAR